MDRDALIGRASTSRTIRAGLLAALLAILAVVVVVMTREPRRPTVPASSHRPVLIFALDGLSWNAFDAARARGLFARFKNAGRHVATYPSMSHPAWTEIMGTPRVYGARGVLPTIEARWFDDASMREADDPRQVFMRLAGSYFYQRAFDYFYDPITEPLMYLRGRKVFDRELAEAERAVLDRFTGSHYVAYLGGPDAMSHTHIGELAGYLAQLDSMIERVVDSLDARGRNPEVWIVSDHGNGGRFREGEAESYLTPVDFAAVVKRAGFTSVHGRELRDSNDVAIVTLALATMVNLYFEDLSRRRALAERVVREPSVDFVTWLEVSDTTRYVDIQSTSGEARLRWRDTDGRLEYAYEVLRDDPLGLPVALRSTAGGLRWIPDSVARAASEEGPYPDALHRLVRAATHQVSNEPDLVVNLRDGWCFQGDLSEFVRMVRTHGSLGAGGTLGVVASSTRPVPAYARGEEILGLMGVAPESLFTSMRDLWPGTARETLRQLTHAGGVVSTGKSDESVDRLFRRRARPIVQSMDYFGKDAALALADAVKGSADDARSQRLDRTRRILDRVNVKRGVADNVDTLLALTDSIDTGKLGERVRLAEERVRGIPELAALAELRSVWSGTTSRAGALEPVRRGAMAMWTLPYFVDAALTTAEFDTTHDTRDLRFADAWFRRGGSRDRIRSDPTRLLGDTSIGRKLFAEIFAERKLVNAVDPATIPLLYDEDISGITVVSIPGIYGELFDGEIWTRGMRAVRDRLGARTLTIPVDGRCSSAINSDQVVRALRDDTRRRVERGHAKPRYLIVGYSKGGIDATEAVLRAPELAREQIAAIVTVATPHFGSPVAERSEIPPAALRAAVSAPKPAACDSSGASQSIWPATRAAFWVANIDSVSTLTHFFSLSFVTDMEQAHPWMKLTKRIGQFREPNDGVVGLSSSRFPEGVHATDLGIVDGDHIAGRLASSFPQDAFIEAIVLTVAELGALDPASTARWRGAVASRRRAEARSGGSAAGRVPSFADALRKPSRPPGGSAGWTPDRTIRGSRFDEFADAPIRELTPARDSAIVFRCDQADMLGFRREYEFYYDASNGGSEGNPTNGFALVADRNAAGGRACHGATRGSSIKMTAIAHRFRPVEYPALHMRLRVDAGPAKVDPSTAKKGVNDAAFKLWLILRDTRPASGGKNVLFGYSWSGVDALGGSAPEGTLLEAASSKRNVVIQTLPEAWLVAIGGPKVMGRWLSIDRDVAADLRRAYPGIPTESLQVIGITIQTDSDDTGETSDVAFETISFRPRRPGG